LRRRGVFDTGVVRDYPSLAAVAAAILAAVEDGILPPGMAPLDAELAATPARRSTGQDARLHGRRDARRYAKHIPVFENSWPVLA